MTEKNTELAADATDWTKMEGETPAIQKLNSLFTSRFVLSRNVPADECVDEARLVASLWGLGPPGNSWDSDVREYLINRFAKGWPWHGQGPATINHRQAETVGEIVREARRILEESYPPR